MIRKCYRCGRVYGEKPPFEDVSVSHGICETCFPGEMKRMEEEVSKRIPLYFDLEVEPYEFKNEQ